jgi:hypothetical protein
MRGYSTIQKFGLRRSSQVSSHEATEAESWRARAHEREGGVQVGAVGVHTLMNPLNSAVAEARKALD